MPEQTETMTPAEALLWLAGLEKNGVPVLDLREPCKQVHNIMVASVSTHSGANTYFSTGGIRSASCDEVGCPGWFPKRERDVLYSAMEKDGWNYTIAQTKVRQADFFKVCNGRLCSGTDANDYLAAVKAMQAAGYG